jgi:hypothetical protein
MKILKIVCGIGAIRIVRSQSNSPPGVDVWCGKAYKSTYISPQKLIRNIALTKLSDASFHPDGWLDPPPKSETPLLNLQAYPRFNIYLEDEEQASLIIDAQIGYEVGVPFCDKHGPSTASSYADWKVEITSLGDESPLDVIVHIHANSTSNEIPLSIKDMQPRFQPYEIEVLLKTSECSETFSASTNIYLLPRSTDGRSVTKLDYLYGGLHVQNGTAWKPIFPYSYYVSWGDHLVYKRHQTAFATSDFNIVHPIPGGGDEPFEPDLFAAYVDSLDGLDQYLMYDMRWTYKNSSLVASQVNALKKHKSILLWYTVDEPDGHSDALDEPLRAYDLIKELDPYHPISLVLNCANFHYAEYTRGADIILTDPYPIAVNTSWSSQWDTVCNSTYGCCGCDDCNGDFRDVSARLDNLKNFQRWLSNAPLGKQAGHPGRSPGGPKSFWGVPQVFGGSEYWQRPPMAEEEMVMVWLFINHGAKGILGWTFPTTAELTSVTSAMAKLVTSDEVSGLLLGDNPRKLNVQADDGIDIDAAAWIVGDRMLVSIVHLGLKDTSSRIVVKLPANVKVGTVRQKWPSTKVPKLRSQDSAIGETEFRVQDERWPWLDDEVPPIWHVEGYGLVGIGLPALTVSIMVMDIH